ncbi:MAG: bifunctional demethylmenaquinone methyltransferase/2-methoxy-6-polyprenyl-1,4-benzoquinol methylase UbiE [Nitrospinae bacterium]|nr:bifunctional demethylmenaquinone methyltransferase/2-methoxy-6-polyprenyl-1,4-benzoquinol methylase UbiE [Nitrospinota bacterium]
MVEKDAAKIERMFSDIAPRYDLLNRLLSMGIDQRWRTAAIKKLAPRAGGVYLDVATGTGDVALEIFRQNPKANVVGVDFAHQMLVMGLPKVKGTTIRLGRGDALNLSFRNATFDGATCAYGIRNFANLSTGLREINRVLKPGASIAILEFTTPPNPLARGLYLFYFTRLLPFIGRLVSGHPEAYTYLPLSVMDFPGGAHLKEIFEKCGFVDVTVAPLTFGISGLITARKPER